MILSKESFDAIRFEICKNAMFDYIEGYRQLKHSNELGKKNLEVVEVINSKGGKLPVLVLSNGLRIKSGSKLYLFFDTKHFFGSPWQELLMDVDMRIYIPKLEKEAEEGYNDWLQACLTEKRTTHHEGDNN